MWLKDTPSLYASLFVDLVGFDNYPAVVLHLQSVLSC